MKSRVKEVMKAKGETIQGLAEKTGLATETIQRARDHRINHCRLETLETIARALGVSVPDLFVDE